MSLPQAEYRWVSLLGSFERREQEIIFHGGIDEGIASGAGETSKFVKIGNYLCDRTFNEGSIEALVTLPETTSYSNACKFLLGYDSESRSFFSAGVEISNFSPFIFRIQYFDPKRVGQPVPLWHDYAATGDRSSVKTGQEFSMKLNANGSRFELVIDGVSVATANLPIVMPKRQVGIWCQNTGDLRIRDFRVTQERAKVFVVMQYSAPYNELFTEVIEPVCGSRDISAIRADETYGPGHVLTDILYQIYTSKLVIAEITPENQNVFFEVGYAYATGKPIIFVAEKSKQLPFDVSGFRVLFYENSIAGKAKIEEQLTRFIDAILSES